VVVREDRPGDRRLVGYVCPVPGAVVDAAVVRRVVGGRLPKPMVPAPVMVIDAMPLTANGKLDRAALPVPAAGNPATGRAPRGPREEIIAETFSEVLATGPMGADQKLLRTRRPFATGCQAGEPDPRRSRGSADHSRSFRRSDSRPARRLAAEFPRNRLLRRDASVAPGWCPAAAVLCASGGRDQLVLRGPVAIPRT